MRALGWPRRPPEGVSSAGRDLDVGQTDLRVGYRVAAVDHVGPGRTARLVGHVDGVVARATEVGLVAAEHVPAAVAGQLLVHLVPVGQRTGAGDEGTRVAGQGVAAALHVDPGVGEVLTGDAPTVEGVPGYQPVDGTFLDVDVFATDARPEAVAQRLVAVTAVRPGAVVGPELVPVALRRTEVQALAVARVHLTGVVDEGVLHHVVGAGRTQVDALQVDEGHLYPVDDIVLLVVQHDALGGARDREADQLPPARLVEVEPVPAVADRAAGYVRVAGTAGVGQHRRPGTGQRDRRQRGTADRGVERALVRAVGEVDDVAGPGSGQRGLQLRRGRHVDRPGSAGVHRRAGRRGGYRCRAR